MKDAVSPAARANMIRPVAAMVLAFITDYYGLYPIFVATAVIFSVGLGVLHFGVRIKD